MFCMGGGLFYKFNYWREDLTFLLSSGSRVMQHRKQSGSILLNHQDRQSFSNIATWRGAKRKSHVPDRI